MKKLIQRLELEEYDKEIKNVVMITTISFVYHILMHITYPGKTSLFSDEFIMMYLYILVGYLCYALVVTHVLK